MMNPHPYEPTSQILMDTIGLKLYYVKQSGRYVLYRDNNIILDISHPISMHNKTITEEGFDDYFCAEVIFRLWLLKYNDTITTDQYSLLKNRFYNLAITIANNSYLPQRDDFNYLQMGDP